MKINKIFEETSDKHVTFCFGRFNPPTLGHKEVFKKMKSQGGDMKIFTTQSQDSKKNPLDYATKVDFIRKIHPDYANDVIEDTNLNTITKVAEYLNDQGYTHATFVGGDDRKNLYDQLVAYNGKEEGKKGPLENKYKFETLEFVSAGAREEGAEGVEGISGTQAREDAANNNLEAFTKHTGAGEHAEELFAAVKKGMGINDSNDTGEKEMNESIYTNPAGGELSRIGRILMDKSVTVKDDALSNVLGRVGDELTRYGEPGGASSIDELCKKARCNKEQLMKMMKWAQQQKDTSLDKVKDPDPKPEDDDEKESIASETSIGHVDDERHMIRKELYQHAKYAKELFTMLEDLPEDSDFPHWWQSKVTKSLQMLSKAKHYLENEMAVPESESIEEGHGDSEKLSALKQACGGEEEMVNTLFSSAVQNGLDDDEFVDAARRMLNMSASDVQSIIDARNDDTTEEGVMDKLKKDWEHTKGLAKAIAKNPFKGDKAAKDYNKKHGKDLTGKDVDEAVCSECGKARFTALPEEMQKQYESVNEEKQKGVDGKVCWKGYKRMGTKKKGGKTVDNCVKM